MNTPRTSLAFLALPLLASACTGMRQAEAPPQPPVELSALYQSALETEAHDPLAVDGYLELVDESVAFPDAPGALAGGLAALDALVLGSVSGLEGAGPTAAAYRSRALFQTVADRLRKAYSTSGNGRSQPSKNLAFLRGTIAHALHDLALFVGDVRAAQIWAPRRGCVSAATVVGPLDWTPLRSLEGPSPVPANEPFAATYPGVAPFATAAAPRVVRSDSCILDTSITSPLQGLRAVVVDLDSPKEQSIRVALTSSSAAIVEVGGAVAVRRGFDAGGNPVTRFGSVRVPAGKVRVVVRLAMRGDGSTIELDAWGENGEPLKSSAPAAGDVAPGIGTAAEVVEITPGESSGEALVAAAGLMALGDSRSAEHLLEPGGVVSTRSPGLELIYARALDAAEDLPDTKANERQRAAIAQTLQAWPESWEARIGRARATERRKGSGDGVVEALRELGADASASPDAKGGDKKPLDPMSAAYAAVTARRVRLHDVAERAYADLEKATPGSPLLAGVDFRIHTRTGPAAVRAACQGGIRRADLECLEALKSRGDYSQALNEIARLRDLRGSNEALRDQELNTRVLSGDLQGALAVYDSLPPGQRRLTETIGYAAGSKRPDDAKSRFERDKLTARDAPYAFGSLIHALSLEKDPTHELEDEGRKLVLADQRKAFLPGAGTAVLRHLEKYRIEASGQVHFVLYDLRRVSGTTDVANGQSAAGPTIEGRAAPRLLRRRIHKRDGRVLQPDAAANASQASDLSQLEAGDYIEHVAEGWALPGDTGQLVIDTVDLLPERTSVREATVEIRRAESLPIALWAHPLLGKARELTDGHERVTVYELQNQPPRRLEDGVPKMERSVGLSLGTQSWANIAKAFEENLRSLDERDPYVSRWARNAAGDDGATGKALVDRIVVAAGKKVKVASASELTDVASLYAGGSQKGSARSILELGQGSRSWVIYRALKQLGISAEMAISEAEPFSSAPDFPAHAGRFRHPLVVAHLGGSDGDVWIDADVEGPPLPSGRVSPELRGRTALLESGKMVTVSGSAGPGAGEGAGDEVDLRLALDEKGNAKGSFTVLLHGRAAQSLAEAFETVVGTDRREVLRGIVLGWLPWADVDEVSVSSSEGSWEIALRATVSVQGYGRPEGKDGKTWTLAGLEPVHIVYPRAVVSTLGATYASRGARQNALSIEHSLAYHFRRRIELPPGATVAVASPAIKIEDPHLSATRRSGLNGRVLEEDFSLNLPTGTVPASEYQSFVSKVQAIDDGFMSGTRIKVKP